MLFIIPFASLWIPIPHVFLLGYTIHGSKRLNAVMRSARHRVTLMELVPIWQLGADLAQALGLSRSEPRV